MNMKKENYKNYMQMSHLPFCNYPMKSPSLLSLGAGECDILQKIFPESNFIIDKVPISCPNNCNITRIYETGNTNNPNLE